MDDRSLEESLLSFHLTSNRSNSHILRSFEFAAPAWNQIPYFLAKVKYRNPSDPLDTPLQMAFNSKSHFFGLLQEREGILPNFSTFMTCHKRGRPEFPDVFPVDTKLVEGFQKEKNDAIFVDVGGGLGQEISTLREMTPGLPGRTILQEVPEMVQSFPGTEGIEIMEHDFFKPQPVKGKRFSASSFGYQKEAHPYPGWSISLLTDASLSKSHCTDICPNQHRRAGILFPQHFARLVRRELRQDPRTDQISHDPWLLEDSH